MDKLPSSLGISKVMLRSDKRLKRAILNVLGLIFMQAQALPSLPRAGASAASSATAAERVDRLRAFLAPIHGFLAESPVRRMVLLLSHPRSPQQLLPRSSACQKGYVHRRFIHPKVRKVFSSSRTYHTARLRIPSSLRVFATFAALPDTTLRRPPPFRHSQHCSSSVRTAPKKVFRYLLYQGDC